MKRMLFILLAGTFCGSGCIDYEEILKLNADGSGEVRMHFAMEKEFIEQMKIFSEQMGGATDSDIEDFTELCSEEEIRAALRDMGSGLELISYARRETDTEIGFTLEFTFTSQDDFRDMVHACPDEDGEDEEDSDPGFSFTYAEQPDGRWRFARDFKGMGGSGASAGSSPEMDMQDYAGYTQEGSAGDPMAGDPMAGMDAGMDAEKMAEAMKQMDEVLAQLQKTNPEAAKQMEAQMQAMGGLNQSMGQAAEKASEHGVRFEVHFPADVVEANATETGARVAVWEYSLDQLQNAPDELEAFIKP